MGARDQYPFVIWEQKFYKQIVRSFECGLLHSNKYVEQGGVLECKPNSESKYNYVAFQKCKFFLAL